eukprot:COSAG01_NODE_5344_length_4322_cov_10.094956_4_plen_107_part_00
MVPGAFQSRLCTEPIWDMLWESGVHSSSVSACVSAVCGWRCCGPTAPVRYQPLIIVLALPALKSYLITPRVYRIRIRTRTQPHAQLRSDLIALSIDKPVLGIKIQL